MAKNKKAEKEKKEEKTKKKKTEKVKKTTKDTPSKKTKEKAKDVQKDDGEALAIFAPLERLKKLQTFRQPQVGGEKALESTGNPCFLASFCSGVL